MSTVGTIMFRVSGFDVCRRSMDRCVMRADVARNLIRAEFPLLLVRAGYTVRDRRLSRFASEEEVLSYLNRRGNRRVAFYGERCDAKRKAFLHAMESAAIALSGKRFLDIGPGHGDSLVLAKNMGAISSDFIEIDPYFFHLNRTRKLGKGFFLNHFLHIRKVKTKYDVVWLAGALQADMLTSLARVHSDRYQVARWLEDLEQLLAPGAQVFITPHWAHAGGKRFIQDVSGSYLTASFLRKGYRILPPIDDHNVEPQYPITFYRRV